jgi:PIN domain nuclease of toxin-antitoxin system
VAVADEVVLDTSAVVALFTDEPCAAAVQSTLRSSKARMSTVNLAEVVDVLIRVHGGSPAAVASQVEAFASSVVEPVTPSLETSTSAGEIRARTYDRSTRRVSLADCFCLATAESGGTVLTTDGPLAAAARAEGIEVVLLGD